MTDTGTIQSRTHDIKGDTCTIDRVIYKVPEFVEPFLARKKDGELVDYDYDLGMDGTTRTLKKIMPHGGKPAGKIGKDPKLNTREGVLVSLDGTNMITVHMAGLEKHFAIEPEILAIVRTANMPQNIGFSYDKAAFVKEIQLREHIENYVFVPASKLATKDDPINHKPVTEKPVIDDAEMKILKEKEQEIAKVRADPTLTDAEKKIISEQKAAEAKAAITRDPATTEKMKKAGFTTEPVTAAEKMGISKPDQKAVLAELLKSGSVTITIGGSTSREQYETRKAEVTATIKSSEEYDAVFGLLYSALDKYNDELLKWKRGSF